MGLQIILEVLYYWFIYRKHKYFIKFSLGRNIFIKVMIKQQWQSQQSPKINKKQYRRFIRTPQQDLQQLQSPYSQLHSANPILPPGVHKDYHQNQILKYRYTIDKSKLHKTSFPQVKTRNWLNQTHTEMSTNKLMSNNNNDDNEIIVNKIQEHQLCQFRQLLTHKTFLYCRINNRLCNDIQKNQQSYFCSMFINCRKEEIKSKKIPVFQYLPRVFKYMKPWACQSDLLTFNSAFQSGNLFCVTKSEFEVFPTYQLFMNNDINTKGCTQWFYFSIKTQRRIKIKIKIMNFYKPTSLYMNGMKILVSHDLVQWKRIGTAIKYNRVDLGEEKQSFYLQFIYQIEKQNKQYYFSYGYPYTYSHLQSVLGNLFHTPIYSRIVNKSVLCQTYLGNSVYMLTISNHLKAKDNQKPLIYVIARQHPGETPGSFIVQGFIRTLLHNRLQMQDLRQNFIVKVVPMVNVDGVINGNYRSNFSGNDVNRQWQEPSRKLHPEIYYLKQQIFNNRKNVQFFLDIHAHSRKMNSFFYGSKGISIDNRLYPFICSKLNKNISYSQSTFVDDASKKTTARVILQNDANIRKSLTFQASFYGYQDQKRKIRNHFKEDDLKGLGQSLALGLYYSEIGSTKLSNRNNEMDKTKKQQVENGRTSVSCHLGNQNKKLKMKQIRQKLQKNCQRIMEKWRKQVQKYKNKDREKDKIKQKDQVLSEGSSIDPEHFQLTTIEQQSLLDIRQMQERYLSLNNKRQKLTITIQQKQKEKQKEDRDKKTKNGIIKQQNKEEQNEQYIKNKSKQRIRMKNGDCNSEQQKQKNQQITKLSFFPMQSNLRNSFIVKKLQTELQMNKTHRRYQSIGDKKESESGEKVIKRLQNEIIRGKRFKSIDVQIRQTSNYRNNIIQIKKALKYFMQNKSYDYKSSDYDDYKNFLKYSTNGNTLILSHRDSVARIKRKYARA